MKCDYEFHEFFAKPPRSLHSNSIFDALRTHRFHDPALEKIKTFKDLENFSRNPASQIIKSELVEIWDTFELERDEINFRQLRY